MHKGRLILKRIAPTPAAIDGFCALVRSWLENAGLGREWFATAMLLRESLNNAMIHGCRANPRGRIHCQVRRGYQWISIEVHDRGEGFDWQRCWLRRARVDETHGRGMQIYRLYADNIEFNRRGNRVRLRRRISKGKCHAIHEY